MRARLILTFAACLAGCGGKAVESESTPDSSADAPPSSEASPALDASVGSTPDATITGAPDATSDSAPPIYDAGPPPPVIDGCVDIDLSTYDRSCQKSSDCVWILSGEVCTGECACGNSVINLSGESRYNQWLSGIQTEECPCPPPGIPICVQGTCTACTPGFCPDGG